MGDGGPICRGWCGKEMEMGGSPLWPEYHIKPRFHSKTWVTLLRSKAQSLSYHSPVRKNLVTANPIFVQEGEREKGMRYDACPGSMSGYAAWVGLAEMPGACSELLSLFLLSVLMMLTSPGFTYRVGEVKMPFCQAGKPACLQPHANLGFASGLIVLLNGLLNWNKLNVLK